MQQPRTFFAPLTIFLAFAAACLTVGQIARVAEPRATVARAGPGARLMELRWAADAVKAGHLAGERGNLLARLGRDFFLGPTAREKPSKNPWDAAVESVLLAEGGKPEEAIGRMEAAPLESFRDCWEAAYSSGPVPMDGDIEYVVRGLSNGLASKLLRASIAEAQGDQDGETLKVSALAEYSRKAAALSLTASALLLAALSGLGVGIWMLAKRPPLEGPPCFRMSAAHALNACLGWYVAFFLSSTVAGYIANAAQLGTWALPLNYSLHAACGIAFICIAEKISPLALWGRLAKKGWTWPLRGAQFLLLAFAAVLAAAWLLSFVMPEGDPPQREIAEFISGSKGVFPILAVFGTVAVLGPVFEEIFFRGFLLSALRRRLPAAGALLVSSALFGCIHFDLQAMPLLAVLGCALGLAFMRTGDIKTAIFVHGCWNGGVFLFQRMLM